MKKKSLIPQTKVKNPEPKQKDEDWISWAAWADRITFEEIKDKTRPTIFKKRYVVENQKLFRVSRLEDHQINEEIENRVIGHLEKLASKVNGRGTIFPL